MAGTADGRSLCGSREEHGQLCVSGGGLAPPNHIADYLYNRQIVELQPG